MNVSYEWLKEYVPTRLDCRQAAEALTHVGLNVDDIADLEGGDARLLVEVTSNRPDCLGHIGVARELAAATDTTLKIPEPMFPELPETVESLTRIEVEDLDLCPLYVARIIRGIRVGPSPDWLRKRLDAVGIRPVNNIVDVTNFVMLECGQPLHAFDYARLAEGRIVVRRAEAGEKFVAIDHSEHALSTDRLVIADARRPVALAGVMGGADSEISDSTTDILLEAAVFDPLSIRTTARRLALASESSYRFERRVDPAATDWASRRACQLIVQVAGGKVARGVATAGKPLPKPLELTLRVPRIKTILGLAIPADTSADILRRLGLEVLEATAERIRVRVPSWRPDLAREIDLIEEVARHHGYEKIPQTPEVPLIYAAPTKAERVRDVAARILTAAGYFEAVTFSFTTAAHAMRLRRADVVADPLVCRGTPLALRQSVAAGLLESLHINRNVGQADARLFEIAKRFVPIEGRDLPQEDAMLALAGGDDFHAVRGALETLFDALHIGRRIRFAATDRYPDLAPGMAAEIFLSERSEDPYGDTDPIGMVGVITDATAKAFDLDDPVTVAEILYAPLVEAADLAPAYRPLPQFPAIARDLAIVVDETVTWARIEQAVAAARAETLESLQPLDVYRGPQVPAGKKSVALRLILRSKAETLKGEQADEAQARILQALQSAVGATLRS